MEIEIIDSLCGTGKTKGMQRDMLTSMVYKGEKFIFITPTLDEVDRILKTEGLNFKAPKQVSGRKENGIEYLVSNNQNIVSTHQMFQRLADTDLLCEISANGYTLVLDEAITCFEEYTGITPEDLEPLLDKNVFVDNTGLLHLNKPLKLLSNSAHKEFYEYCSKHLLYLVNGMNGEPYLIMWTLSRNLIKMFDRVVVLTYMFESSWLRVWCDTYGVTYRYITPQYLIDKEKELKALAREKLTVKLLDIKELSGFSGSYFAWRNIKPKQVKALKTRLESIVSNSRIKIQDMLITCPEDAFNQIAGKGYTRYYVKDDKGKSHKHTPWLSVTTRATNDHKHKRYVFYLLKRNYNPRILTFLSHFGVSAIETQDQYALSEAIQFVYRSSIREGNETTVYFLVKEMYDLFLAWLNE